MLSVLYHHSFSLFIDAFIPISIMSCRILFRGSGGPRDYAARRISGAKLSFAFTSVLRLWSLPHQFSTFLLTVSRSYFAPIINTGLRNVPVQMTFRKSNIPLSENPVFMVEAAGIAPASCPASELLQRTSLFIQESVVFVKG